MIDILKFNSFSDVLNKAAEKYADNIFLIENEKKVTYKDFNFLVNRCANYLIESGVNQNDIVSMILKNSIEYAVIYFAATRVGAIINPLPFHLSSDEILEKLFFLNPAAVFTQEKHYENISQKIQSVYKVDSELISFLNKYSDFQNDIQINTENTGYMYYSSGTTGLPKIIEYSHKSELLTMASQLRTTFKNCCDGPHLCFLPLGHTAAIRYSMFPCLITGNTLIVCESFWKIRTNLWNLIEKYKVVYMQTVPSILIALLNTKYQNYNMNQIESLKWVGCGSSFLPIEIQNQFELKYNKRISNLYGLSETGPTHFDDPFCNERKPGSIGKPLDIMQIKIFDDDRKEAGKNITGEIAVKGPSLLKNYYKNSELFNQCFYEDYFLTGDLGYVDNEGIYYYVDRKKDLIIKGGINIAPAQIDETLIEFPDIIEAATIGVPDMYLGENIKSYVVLKEDAVLDVKKIKLFCKEKLGDFKTPAYIEQIDELPKGPSGKILKRKLREIKLNY